MARISSLIIAAGAAALVSAAVASATDTITGDPSATDPSMMNLCGTRAEMVSRLADQFHENPLAVGQVNQSAVLEVFVSDTGSWTILATGTDGRSCVLSAGEGWQTNAVVALGDGA